MITIEHGDCRDVLRRLADEGVRVHSCVTDPPYHLTSIVKRFGAEDSAPARAGATGAYKRHSTGFMGKKWDGGDVAFQPETWRLAFDLLPPGGHLLAFGGTRTYHRLACAIEDAGFEIRDQIGWLYASGFPKSHDVAKGIDRAAGEEREDKFEGAFSRRAGPTGNKKCNVCGKWLVSGSPCQCPRPQDEPKSAAAREWQGWGTALKPAWEPIVLARKPLGTPATNVLDVVEFHLRQMGVQGEIRWKSDSVSVAARISSRTSSSSTEAQQAAATSVESAAESETPKTEKQDRKSSDSVGTTGRHRTQDELESMGDLQIADCENRSSLPTAGNAPAAENLRTASSQSTMSAAAERHIEEPSARSTVGCAATASRPATEFFAGIATGLSGSLANVLIIRDSDGTFVWPDGIPKHVPAQNLTVAANVLAHGTGALNVDGCRVGTTRGVPASLSRNKTPNGFGPGGVGIEADLDPNIGRWPANIVHDGSEEVLAAFAAYGESGGGKWSQSGERAPRDNPVYGKPNTTRHAPDNFGDSGTAARFFYTAKADAADRLGSKHPTVKPVSLMRWLVRLVTPPGGLVLDPFAGTGTTGMACMAEGFDAVLIEREAEYVADIRRRVAHVRGEDAPLFAGPA